MDRVKLGLTYRWNVHGLSARLLRSLRACRRSGLQRIHNSSHGCRNSLGRGCRSSLGRGCRSSLGRGWLSTSFSRGYGTRASDAWQDDVVCVDLQREVLQGGIVLNGVGAVGARELEDTGIVFGVVLEEAVAEGGHVVETVHEVGAEVGVCLELGDGVAQCAELLEGSAGLVRVGADDCFVGGVLSAPVAAPF